MNARQRGIIAQIESIKRRVEKVMYFENGYICVYATTEPYAWEIKKLVEMHIGDTNESLGTFLKMKWGMGIKEPLPYEVVNSYRICMLNNMIRMVKEGEYV